MFWCIISCLLTLKSILILISAVCSHLTRLNSELNPNPHVFEDVFYESEFEDVFYISVFEDVFYISVFEDVFIRVRPGPFEYARVLPSGMVKYDFTMVH